MDTRSRGTIENEGTSASITANSRFVGQRRGIGPLQLLLKAQWMSQGFSMGETGKPKEKQRHESNVRTHIHSNPLSNELPPVPHLLQTVERKTVYAATSCGAVLGPAGLDGVREGEAGLMKMFESVNCY